MPKLPSPTENVGYTRNEKKNSTKSFIKIKDLQVNPAVRLKMEQNDLSQASQTDRSNVLPKIRHDFKETEIKLESSKEIAYKKKNYLQTKHKMIIKNIEKRY